MTRFHFVSILAGLTAPLVRPLTGQEPGPVFRSGVSLVRVDAEVSDSAGLTLTSLGKDDFRVLDEGKEQPVVNFSFEEEPLDLILLFDLSGSMHSKLLRVVRAVELGFHELKPGDRVAVMAYHAGADEIAPFTTDLNAVNETILLQVLPQHFGGSSNPERAMADAARRFRREPKDRRRRAVLVITDKAAAASGETPATVRELWQADAVLSELELSGTSKMQVLDRGNRNVSSMTGGATVVAGPPGPSFQEAVRLLRRRYTLYYAAPGGQAGSSRTVSVQLSDPAAKKFPGAHVRCRSGYLVRSE